MAAQTASDPNTSPSSSVIRRFKYDVFLSFRGEDSRRTFSDHLCVALRQRGIHTFIDDEELLRGSSISTELLNAIEESRCSIVILSERYAESRWCLDDLAKIVECKKVMGQKVLPVFYYVDPSEVRRQTGNFGKAFSKHEQASKDITEKVQRWRAALSEVANLSGWRIGERDGYESKVIEQIVKVVTTLLQPDLLDLGKLVGIESRVEEINVLLDIESNDVRFIGIWGIGGIGKTTIAKTIFNRICHKFEVFTFLPDIREVSRTHDLLELQMRFLREILMQGNIDVRNVNEGATMIKNILCKRKVLLILDDVDNLDQLQSLAGSKGWFGSGSRVIISTRNERLLNWHGVDKIFEVKELSDDEALQLFRFQAFRKDQPEEDYLELSKQVVRYAGGVPLALKVLGSSLMGRSQSIWYSALQRLKEIPDSQVNNVLKISYDGISALQRLKEIPDSLVYNVHCINLNSLPSTLGNLKSLKSLNVSGCSKLCKLPESFGKLECLEQIDLSGTAIKEWPSSFVLLKNLKSFFFSWTERAITTTMAYFPPISNNANDNSSANEIVLSSPVRALFFNGIRPK